MNIPNKIADALARGLPVVTPLRGEVAALITGHGVGCCYGEGSPRTLHECLCMLLDDDDLRSQQARAARALYDAQFTYEKVYGRLVRLLEELATRRLAGEVVNG
jgi:glycosyltransferase involved in cell wall biosynthesis